jgi:ubiquinone/menaquinone biosynthesis C-methylase UbiE
MDARVAEREHGTDWTSAATDTPSYALGYSEREFRRLEFQGEFFREFTEDVLRRAGLAPGMRVLDLGCGVGDVALVAAELVGRSGMVLGVDRSQEALDVAWQRAEAAGHHHACFSATELDAFSSRQTFDAIIGRLILAYLPNPAATLRRLRGCLRPGGIVAFQEMASPLVRSVPEGPYFRQCCRWILDTFERAGFELDMGGKLFATFLAAGLPPPHMVAASRVEGGPQSPVYDYIAEILRSLLPMTERLGVATAAEIAIDTVAERLREEAIKNNACIMLPPLVGAWTHMPARAGLDMQARRGASSDRRARRHARTRRLRNLDGRNGPWALDHP